MTVVVFKSKAEVFSFLDKAKAFGISGSVVSTPKELKTGCGLSVGLNDNYATFAVKIVNSGNFPTFFGIFRLKRNGLKSTLTKIY